MRKKFDGMYYKHQKGANTVSFIAGVSVNNHAFIQVITNEKSYYFTYSLSDCEYGEIIKIGGNIFSEDGVKICIEERDVSICGEIKYAELTPLKYDIMGP